MRRHRRFGWRACATATSSRAAGSIVPLFLAQRDSGVLTITDERMTRFLITLDQAVDFVISSAEQMIGGEIFIPRMPSVTITDSGEGDRSGRRVGVHRYPSRREAPRAASHERRGETRDRSGRPIRRAPEFRAWVRVTCHREAATGWVHLRQRHKQRVPRRSGDRGARRSRDQEPCRAETATTSSFAPRRSLRRPLADRPRSRRRRHPLDRFANSRQGRRDTSAGESRVERRVSRSARLELDVSQGSRREQATDPAVDLRDIVGANSSFETESVEPRWMTPRCSPADQFDQALREVGGVQGYKRYARNVISTRSG